MRRVRVIVGLAVLMAPLAGCSTTDVKVSDEEAAAMIDESNGAERVALGTNQFGLELGRHIEKGQGNAVWSPYSAASALEMVHLGARGETASEMSQTLRTGQNPHENMQALRAELDKEPSALLRIVNDVWIQQDFSVAPDYVAGLERHYDAEPRLTDFHNAPEEARQAINKRVSEVTEQKIEELLPENSLKSDTRLVLVNAVYLNARWLTPFPAAETKPRPFHLADGSAVEVDTMHRKHTRKYVDAGDFKAVSLPYAGNLAAMVILPDEGEFDAVAGSMSAAMLRKMQDEM